MKLLLSSIILLYSSVLFAQEKKLPNTAVYWLKIARSQALEKDTTGMFSSLLNAAKAGLFEPQAVTGRKAFVDMLSGEQLNKIEKSIVANRKKIEKPHHIKVVTSDITRFWKLFPHIEDSTAPQIFFENYILKGSVGLQTFFQMRMNSNIQPFINKVRSIQHYYSSIQVASQQFRHLNARFVSAAKKLEALYPASIFPPIYFFIRGLNNVGTTDGYAGLLIATEHLCRHKHADTSQLNDFEKMVLFDSSLAVPLIVHE